MGLNFNVRRHPWRACTTARQPAGEIVIRAIAQVDRTGPVAHPQPGLPRASRAGPDGYIKAGKEGARSSHPYATTAADVKYLRNGLPDSNGSDSVRSQAVLRLGFGAHLSTKQRREIASAAAKQEHEAALAAHRRDAAALKADGRRRSAQLPSSSPSLMNGLLIRWLDSVPDGLAPGYSGLRRAPASLPRRRSGRPTATRVLRPGQEAVRGPGRPPPRR